MGIFPFRNKDEKRAQEDFMRRVDERLAKLLDGKEEERSFLETLSQDIRQNGTDIRQNSTDIRQNSADIRKHDMALEDCLDALEERQEEETQSEKRIDELKEEQNRLLQLLEAYQEQMWNMRKYAAEHDPAWVPQLELARETVRGKEVPCGIVLIEETGVKVDYALHEVIEILDTAEEERSQTVAGVYQPGYVYRGVVKRKAKVAAYR